MKFLGLSLAVFTFGVISFLDAPSVYTAGPEQSVIAAMQSPGGEAWLSSMLSSLPQPASAPGTALPPAGQADASSEAVVHFVRTSHR